MKKGRAMQETKELSDLLVIFAVVLLCFCSVARACPDPECDDCYSWNGQSCVLDGSCKKCSGYSPWSGGVEPDPPSCSPNYVATRTLGSCVTSSTPSSCSAGTHQTRHIKTYMSWIDPIDEGICFAAYMICTATIPLPPLCDEIYQDCLDAATECVKISDNYDTPQTGCLG